MVNLSNKSTFVMKKRHTDQQVKCDPPNTTKWDFQANCNGF